MQRVEKAIIASENSEAGFYLLQKFKRLNLECSVVCTGRACLDIVQNNELAIAVIDNSISDIQGDALVDLLMNLTPELKVIFVNSSHDPEIEYRVRQLGVVYYASNLSDGKIVSVVSRVLKKKNISKMIPGLYGFQILPIYSKISSSHTEGGVEEYKPVNFIPTQKTTTSTKIWRIRT